MNGLRAWLHPMSTVWLALMVVLGGTALLSGGRVAAASAVLHFTARALEHGQFIDPPEITVEGDRGQITIHAKLSAPDPCHKIAGELERVGASLTLHVSVQPDGSQGCIAVIGTFAYEAVIDQLSPGAYPLRIMHTYAPSTWPSRTVFEGQIHVR